MPGTPVTITLTGRQVIGNQPVGGDVFIQTADGKYIGQQDKIGATGTLELNNFKSSYTVQGTDYLVTDYHQVTGDPGVLSVAAFDSGFLVDSLWDWLAENGYNNALNPIIQPDFLPLDNSVIYYAVDLAQLLNAGLAFNSSSSFGTTFQINNNTIPGLPGYQFSSTLPIYVPGSGWAVTPLADGTTVQYAAFHSTYTLPEPHTLLLALIGLVAIFVTSESRRYKTYSVQRTNVI
ncbi:MAG: hypothetical protein NTAFB09_05780 [Nitrosospira sp.]